MCESSSTSMDVVLLLLLLLLARDTYTTLCLCWDGLR